MTNPMSAFQTALLTAGINGVDVVFLGDSFPVGSIAGRRERAFPQRFRDRARAAVFAGSVRGGLGYCPAFSSSPNVGNFWIKNGPVEVSPLLTGLGCRALKAPSGASVSLTFTGTGCDLVHTSGTNSCFAYGVDIESEQSIDARIPSGVIAGNIVPIRGLCDGVHTITVRGTAQGAAYVEGAMVYRNDEDTGIRVWESGHSGWRAADFNATDRWHGSFLAIPAPKLVVVTIGANEYRLGDYTPAYALELDELVLTLRDLIGGRACSILLVSQHGPVPISGRAPWSLYASKAEEVAAARGCGYVSMVDVIGETSSAIATGLIEPVTGLHPLKAGHDIYSGAIANYALNATA